MTSSYRQPPTSSRPCYRPFRKLRQRAPTAAAPKMMGKLVEGGSKAVADPKMRAWTAINRSTIPIAAVVHRRRATQLTPNTCTSANSSTKTEWYSTATSPHSPTTLSKPRPSRALTMLIPTRILCRTRALSILRNKSILVVNYK